MTDREDNREDAQPAAEVTLLLQAVRNDEDGASERLLDLVYGQLHRLADAKMQGERVDHTLQATALVHEAYLRLLGSDGGFENRRHFFGAAAQAMRRILIDRYRRRQSEKRGGDRERVDAELDGEIASAQQDGGVDALDLLALDEALAKLEARDPRMAQIVMLRFFAGLDVEETASALEISTRTVKRDWAVARAWLFQELGGGEGRAALPTNDD